MNLKRYFIISLFLLMSLSSIGQRINIELTRATEDQKTVLLQLDQILKNYSKVDSMLIEFKENKPNYLEIYSSSSLNSIEYFDLNFLGDQYLLARKYNNLLDSLQSVELEYFKGIQDSNQNDRICFYVTRQSLSYRYTSPPSLNYANFNIFSLRESLNNSFKKGSDVPRGDSILIIQCIVNPDRSLGDIGLITGIHSSFYDFVLRQLRQTGKLWYPMTNSSGKPLRGLVDIYVKLDQYDNITVSITGRSRKLQIKDNDRRSTIYF